jgi:PAS domain S-box-containing protein
MLSFAAVPGDSDAVQETLLGEALEHGPVGAIVLDEAGRYLATNRKACELSGYSREELLRGGSGTLSTDPDGVPNRLRELAAGRLKHGVVDIRRKDGTLKTIEFRAGATRSGGLPYFVVVFWEAEAA